MYRSLSDAVVADYDPTLPPASPSSFTIAAQIPWPILCGLEVLICSVRWNR